MSTAARARGTDMTAAERIIDVLDEWQAGINAGDPARVAAVFTTDAVFQGLHPYGVGRQAVTEYYASQPNGMTVTYDVLQSRSPVADVVHGYVAATFSYLDRPSVEVFIGVVLTRVEDGWKVAQYQASRLV